jgi:serine/threonine protein kinase
LESEIVNLFSQIVQGVAHLHSQSPPIIHRDLKVENILQADSGIFKLCDFGSCTTQQFPAGSLNSIQEIRKMEEEISKYTTYQYRAPELIDLYEKKEISEKVDIWALGVLLYKLCFFVSL